MRLFTRLGEAGISADMIHVTPERIAFIVDGKLEKRLKGILEDLGWPFEVTAGLAKVSAVGAGMHGVPGVMARVASALYRAGVEILADDRLPCEHFVPGAPAKVKDAVLALHKEFGLEQRDPRRKEEDTWLPSEKCSPRW